MKKRISFIKKITRVGLSAVLISLLIMQGQVYARETEQPETEAEDIAGTEQPEAEAEDSTGTERPEISGEPEAETSDKADAEKQNELPGGKEGSSDNDVRNDAAQEEADKGLAADGTTEGTAGQEGDPVLPPAMLPQMAVAVKMETSDPMYAQLQQFLSLIADRFQIYTVGVVELTDPSNPSDPSAWQPVNPETPVEVSLDIPEGYDMSRTVVAEIGQEAGSQTPSWTEITYANVNGSAVFETDHSGLFAVVEEKQWAELPGSLELTSKVDKLELTKAYPSESGAFPMSLKYSTSVPATGDDSSVFIWGIVTVLAVVVLAAAVIVIIKRRK